MENNVSTEYQLLQAYHRKRRLSSHERFGLLMLRGAVVRDSSQDDYKRKKKSKEKKISKSVASADTDEQSLDSVTDKLTQIVDEAPLARDEIVADSGPDVIQRLVQLLKESGDRLNEKIQKDHELLSLLQSSFSYGLFEKLASTFIHSIVPAGKPKEKASEQKTQIAWTFEMTSKLSTLDLLPMNKVMGFGAQYLHQYFTPWIQQHGGWTDVLNSDESDNEVQ